MRKKYIVRLTMEERQALEAEELIVHTAGKAVEQIPERVMCPDYPHLLPDRRISLASAWLAHESAMNDGVEIALPTITLGADK